VRDSRIQGNLTDGSGGGLYLRGQGSPSVFNCLITYNQASRDGGGISTNWFAITRVGNCTFVGNAAPGIPGPTVGTLIEGTGLGGALFCGYEGTATVLNSILFDNQALKGTEIAVGSGFELDPRCGRVDVAYSAVAVGPNDLFADRGCVLTQGSGLVHGDPLFVSGPLGTYYLSQVEAGQGRTSPCVDAGSDAAGALGLTRTTTAIDGRPDVRRVDMGYHYPILQPCKFCDIVFDGVIDFHDLAAMAAQWLRGTKDRNFCNENNGWCGGGDVTFDGTVNVADLQEMADCWLAYDSVPPMTDPPRWQTEPRRMALPQSTVEMIAEPALDAWGWDVQYLFERVSGDGHSSSWQTSTRYEDGNVKTDGEATYRFKVRDGLGNETEWSATAYVGPVVVGCTPPAGALNLQQIAVDPCSVTVQGSRLVDPEGVQYYFDIESPDVNDSGWIVPDPNLGLDADPNYRFAGLRPSTTYRFRYQARDRVGLCMTAWSGWLSVTTLPSPDRIAPTPSPMQWDAADDPNGPVGWGGRPFAVYVAEQLGWAAQMTAVVATDASGYVEYFFDCVSDVAAWDKGFDSGWTTLNTYRVFTGNHPGGAGLSFRVRARDAYQNMTDWSELVAVPFFP